MVSKYIYAPPLQNQWWKTKINFSLSKIFNFTQMSCTENCRDYHNYMETKNSMGHPLKML